MRHALCALIFAVALPAHAYTPLPEPFAVGAFALTDQHGNKVSGDDLRGKVWIAHFFYPTCQGPCTQTVPTMRRLHEIFAGKPDIVLVSIALTGDSPALLERFARDHDAGPGWLFLTRENSTDDVLRLVQTSFAQTALRKDNPRPGDEIEHTVSLFLVDREGNMRGYVDGRDASVAPEFAEQARALAAERYRLPALNAVLNSLSALLLVCGWLAIKRRRERLHTACMLAALATSALFLAGYLWFHFAIQGGQPTRFRGPDPVRIAYFAVLISHTILAMAVAPLALYVAWQGWRDHRPRHVRLARWTLPIWLYVSVTGVVVYWMLYQMYPPY
jgi:protein SCO1/2